jgi:hypothetical protein
VKWRPAIMSSLANHRPAPLARISVCNPRKGIPNAISGIQNSSVSAAKTKSVALASPQPPPTAKPLTAAIARPVALEFRALAR